MKNSNSTRKFFEVYRFSPTFVPTRKLVKNTWITLKKGRPKNDQFADFLLYDHVSLDDG